MQRHTPPGPLGGPSNPTPHAPSSSPDWQTDNPVLATVGPGSTPPGVSRWDEDMSLDADALAELFLGDPDLAPAPASPPAATIAAAAHVPAAPRPRAGATPAQAAPAESSTARAQATPAAPPPRLEALILGHLPILGTAWIAGYAQLLAARLGTPVALAKLRGGYLTIDAFGLDTRAGEPKPSLQSELPDAIRLLRDRSARWLLCTDATDEPLLVTHARPDGVTMLTSADDAAVVGSYQAIKGLLDAPPGQPTWPDTADLTIALAGSAPERARISGDKLRSAVRTFLGRTVHVEVCPQRIGPTPCEPLFSGAWQGTPVQLAALLRTPAPAPAPVAPSTTEPDEPVAIRPQAPGRGSHIPAPPAAPSPDRPKAAGRASMSAYIDGLSGIHISCPYAPSIELAMDHAGLLHLVSDVQGLSSLHRVAAWAKAHDQLIRAAIPSLATSDPVCHVVSEDAASLRPLIESDLRVHLVIRGRAGSETFAVARALN